MKERLTPEERVIKELRAKAADLQAQLEALQQAHAQENENFCAAINHAIKLGVEGSEFLRCWNEGDWDGCREFDFEPSATLTGGGNVRE